MQELIGKRCSIIFQGQVQDWPIPGYPAWATVVDVDMPMVCFDYCGERLWVNAALIARIRSTS